jgi:hypothetical protein
VSALDFIPGWIWLGLKTFFFVSLFSGFAHFPRYRYDQIMRLGWKVFIPLTLVWLVVVASGCSRPGISGNKGRLRLKMELLRIFSAASCSELFKGMALTGATVRARSRCSSRRKDADVAALPWPARAAPLSQRRRALHRLQAVRSGVPGDGHHHRIEQRDDGRAAPRATTST